MTVSFEKASRARLRFAGSKGAMTIEDLWSLPLTSRNCSSLERVAQECYRQVKDAGEISFVSKASPADAELTFKLDIVKHIISVRVAENQAKQDAVATAQHNLKIDGLIEEAQMKDLQGKSVEELLALKK